MSITAGVLHLFLLTDAHVRGREPIGHINFSRHRHAHILRLIRTVPTTPGIRFNHRPICDTLSGAERDHTALVLRALKTLARVRDTLASVTDLCGLTGDHIAGVLYADTVYTDLTLLWTAKRTTASVLAEAIKAGARSGAAHLSTREDTLTLAAEARLTTVDPYTRVGLTALRATALTLWAASKGAVFA